MSNNLVLHDWTLFNTERESCSRRPTLSHSFIGCLACIQATVSPLPVQAECTHIFSDQGLMLWKQPGSFQPTRQWETHFQVYVWVKIIQRTSVISQKHRPCSHLVLACVLGDQITSGQLWVCVFTPGAGMCLKWTLVIVSQFCYVEINTAIIWSAVEYSAAAVSNGLLSILLCQNHKQLLVVCSVHNMMTR